SIAGRSPSFAVRLILRAFRQSKSGSQCGSYTPAAWWRRPPISSSRPRPPSGMGEAAADLVFSPSAAQAAREALRAGAPIFCDARMVAEGVTRARLPANNDVVCTLSEPSTPGRAAELGTTRTAAAIELWLPRLQGAVVVIGNAPT